MNLLLDTHVVIWWRADDKRLTAHARQTIADADIVFVSVASAWEAAIKMGLGRLRLPEAFGRGVEKSGFQPLPITFDHTDRVAALPHHHGDPFDRMLIAQAQTENLTIVSGDRRLEPYGASIVWT